jgi:ribosome recycling factor
MRDTRLAAPPCRFTLDNMKAMAKLVKAEADRSKNSVRHARQKALDAVRKSFKATDEKSRKEKEVGEPSPEQYGWVGGVETML